jgi:hypothetical protein
MDFHADKYEKLFLQLSGSYPPQAALIRVFCCTNIHHFINHCT